MTLEYLLPNMQAFDDRVHRLRGYRGAIECAENIRMIVGGSEILKQKPKKVQESYSFRSTPKVVGAVKDTLRFARDMIETEVNGVGDNPLFFEDDGGMPDGGELPRNSPRLRARIPRDSTDDAVCHF
jgi:histidine ammonia-lyase